MRDDSGLLNGDFIEIDFAQNAASMGARTWHANTPDEFRAALREARQETRACVIVVETDVDRNEEAVAFAVAMLEKSAISIASVAEMPRYAEVARSELSGRTL